MKYFKWNEIKNEQLKNERNISFEIIVSQIEIGKVLDILKHPNEDKYGNQQILVVEHEKYAYLIPFVEKEEEIFLKTIIPSRKATKKYLRS
jgi:hypothetical protein